jgi:hypothetical protein
VSIVKIDRVRNRWLSMSKRRKVITVGALAVFLGIS